ncbi:HNH endonuclease [Bifidobacterium scaligerum]|uniref:HNH endonuclease n=1 Tax=Bifidobacterium scaligerum TaxID=2052656 RepID=A0A2M9HT44_9BIFI|nr:HNH endonuclease [Bifidobacterium scaligerum]PJM79984.1 hypothetical protein CUU80_02290 [Bifidobacterium scaligerum]
MSGKDHGPSEQVRRLVLARDGYRCVACGRSVDGVWSGYSIHHRHLRSHPFPGLHSPSNLITLCGSGTTGCHGEAHQNRVLAQRMGWIIPMWNEHPESSPVRDARRGWMLLDDEGHATPCDEHGTPSRWGRSS